MSWPDWTGGRPRALVGQAGDVLGSDDADAQPVLLGLRPGVQQAGDVAARDLGVLVDRQDRDGAVGRDGAADAGVECRGDSSVRVVADDVSSELGRGVEEFLAGGAAVVDDDDLGHLGEEARDELQQVEAGPVCRDDRDDGRRVGVGYRLRHAGTASTTPSSRPSQSAIDARLRSSAGRASPGAPGCQVTWLSRRTPAARSALRSTRATRLSP